MEEQVQQEVMREQKHKSTCKVIGAVISVGVLDFWFGIGAALGTKMVNHLEELINRKC